MEGRIKKGENLIYAATMEFAWDELKRELKDSIIDIESKELRLINSSKPFKGVLRENEYKTTIEIKENTITAKAHFQMLLPFVESLTEFKLPLNFKNWR